jgi:hypothetical protein
MDPRAIRNLVKEDLGITSPAIVQWPLLTPDALDLTEGRCHKLLNKLKASQPNQVQIVFN